MGCVWQRRQVKKESRAGQLVDENSRPRPDLPNTLFGATASLGCCLIFLRAARALVQAPRRQCQGRYRTAGIQRMGIAQRFGCKLRARQSLLGQTAEYSISRYQ